MIKPIVRDVFFLGQKSDPATRQDLAVGQDLMDTLAANRDRCVGMAANMIGVPKSIIAVLPPGMQQPLVMLNPQIIAKSGAYDTEEGCLSLPGERPVTRFRVITVKWQIIQHETDHCGGILI